MRRRFSDDQVRRLRGRAQCLDPRDAAASVVDVAVRTAGLQDQDRRAAALEVRARSVGLLAEDVRAAREVDRTIVRTWLQRGTLHVVATDDLAWLQSLVVPVTLAAARTRGSHLGIDDGTAERAFDLIESALQPGEPRTRGELVALLRSELRADLSDQAYQHLVRRAGAAGVVCFGPDRGKEPTHVLQGTWVRVSPPPPRDEALVLLVRRHLAAYAPARPEDVATWSGVRITDVRRGWAEVAAELVEVETSLGPMWIGERDLDERGDRRRPTWLRLLPDFDTALLGYRGRELLVDPEHARELFPGGGMILATVVVDGRAVGRWRLARRGRRANIEVAIWERLDRRTSALLEKEVADIGRYAAITATLDLVTGE